MPSTPEYMESATTVNLELAAKNIELEKRLKNYKGWLNAGIALPCLVLSIIFRLVNISFIICTVCSYLLSCVYNKDLTNIIAIIKNIGFGSIGFGSIISIIYEFIPNIIIVLTLEIIALIFLKTYKKFREEEEPKSKIEKMVRHYKNKAKIHIVFARFFLFLAIATAGLGLAFINSVIEQYFSDRDLTNIIAITENIGFGSILYQWIPKFTFLLIIEGGAIYFLNIYRRLDNLATYYSSRRSSLDFFTLLFESELKDSFKDIDKTPLKAKILLNFAETHKPEYIFKHVLYRKRKKYVKNNGVDENKLLETIKMKNDLEEMKENIDKLNKQSPAQA